MADTLRIRVDVAADVDDDLLARMAGDLRAELLELDVESVTRPAGPPPSGSKAGEALAIGALLIAVAPSVVEGLMTVLASWLSRQPADVTVKIDGQEFAGTVTRKQRDALVNAFLARVAPPDDQA
ncbi:hypothetical protein Ais01nite_05180 [Asanoa ishikariensis]|uniref:Uncharacterized protein n=1 Tax=Asanoa ishikariensis TaxID=137265 RepID=A0A1H3TJ17_9ACTN|nr:hypothetical protein [Asanoa ishikariensis]GIF62483.1 hypothetical protein Ais01nite_05180 [Asanoa ishikariensis]SDZ49329.1 hypothetical protein SAMN05421684_5715 [Asanoa ishikariensis]